MKNREIRKLDISSLTTEKLAGTIDHAVLRAHVTEKDIEEGCSLSSKYGVATICVKPYHVKLCTRALVGSDVKVAAVVGFPLGGHLIGIKVMEALKAVKDGAQELDMVLNIGALRDGRYDYLREEIEKVVEAGEGALVKVILENCYLTREQMIQACRIAEESGADYVKTSTGFGPEGAREEDVDLMYKTVAPGLGVKASGGIRNLDDAIQMLRTGATRLGTSSTQRIMEEWIEREGKS